MAAVAFVMHSQAPWMAITPSSGGGGGSAGFTPQADAQGSTSASAVAGPAAADQASQALWSAAGPSWPGSHDQAHPPPDGPSRCHSSPHLPARWQHPHAPAGAAALLSSPLSSAHPPARPSAARSRSAVQGGVVSAGAGSSAHRLAAWKAPPRQHSSDDGAWSGGSGALSLHDGGSGGGGAASPGVHIEQVRLGDSPTAARMHRAALVERERRAGRARNVQRHRAADGSAGAMDLVADGGALALDDVQEEEQDNELAYTIWRLEMAEQRAALARSAEAHAAGLDPDALEQEGPHHYAAHDHDYYYCDDDEMLPARAASPPRPPSPQVEDEGFMRALDAVEDADMQCN